jgi:hypothetical protein
MFYGYTTLSAYSTSLNISNFDTSKVTDMSNMFGGCVYLNNIIGTLDLSSCTNVEKMFNNCNPEVNIHLKNVPRSLDFSTSKGIEGQHYIIDNYID